MARRREASSSCFESFGSEFASSTMQKRPTHAAASRISWATAHTMSTCATYLGDNSDLMLFFASSVSKESSTATNSAANCVLLAAIAVMFSIVRFAAADNCDFDAMDKATPSSVTSKSSRLCFAESCWAPVSAASRAP
eukprot:11520486-Alexandrium_andersonii.AAC.1